MALAWARRGATRTERRREKEREKKIGVLRSARKLVISWNEIFFSRVSLVAGSDRPRSPRDSSVRPAERSMDRQFRSSQSSERSADLLLSLFLCLLDGSAVTSDKDDLRSSYFQLITAIHYGEGRRTRVCVYVYTCMCVCVYVRVYVYHTGEAHN